MNLAALARPWGEIEIVFAEDGKTLLAYVYARPDEDHPDDDIIEIGPAVLYPDLARKAEPA